MKSIILALLIALAFAIPAVPATASLPLECSDMQQPGGTMPVHREADCCSGGCAIACAPAIFPGGGPSSGESSVHTGLFGAPVVGRPSPFEPAGDDPPPRLVA